ncbi:MAG: hypothetical protein K2X77_33685 [Candidatus Obscuribacterales bacterium]|jgi:hypothetical protein|nr:hypothetical protein [Candidatus Obscuribacterales bacterium]
MQLQNTLVFQVIFGLAKLSCIALATIPGIFVGSAIIMSIGSPVEMWMLKFFATMSAVGACMTFEAVKMDRRRSADDYIEFLPGGYWKRGTWWTLPRLLAYWSAVPGVLFGVSVGAIYAITDSNIVLLPGMVVVFTALTITGGFAHYHIRSRINWLPFD